MSMLRDLCTVVGGGPRFWAFTGLTTASAAAQAAAVLALLPVLDRLLGPDPASAGAWLLVLIALIAAAWCLDVVNAHVGLRLGIRVMRVIHERVPRAVMAWPASALTPAKVARLRTLGRSRWEAALIYAPFLQNILVSWKITPFFAMWGYIDPETLSPDFFLGLLSVSGDGDVLLTLSTVCGILALIGIIRLLDRDKEDIVSPLS